VIERVAGKDYTTLAEIERMRGHYAASAILYTTPRNDIRKLTVRYIKATREAADSKWNIQQLGMRY
jgi:hypothetical protein